MIGQHLVVPASNETFIVRQSKLGSKMNDEQQ